jgi:hypothetical protein
MAQMASERELKPAEKPELGPGEYIPRRVQPSATAFTSFPSSFDYDVTSRRGKQVTVAPGIERGELGSEEETDYATTE